jgi:hypothetical protein
LAGETLHGLAKRHDICRNLIRVCSEVRDWRVRRGRDCGRFGPAV